MLAIVTWKLECTISPGKRSVPYSQAYIKKGCMPGYLFRYFLSLMHTLNLLLFAHAYYQDSLDHHPVPINTDQNYVIDPKCRSMPINSSQFRIDWHWEVFWINARTLIGIRHWLNESWYYAFCLQIAIRPECVHQGVPIQVHSTRNAYVWADNKGIGVCIRDKH